MKGFFLIWTFLIFSLLPVLAQDSYDFTANDRQPSSQAPENPAPIPRQFRQISLGMALDDLKTALAKDNLFTFRGDRDVSFLPIREQTLVETTGLSYVRRVFFQLSSGNVFIMSFSLDTRMMDHYSVYTTFVKKYGEPKTLSPLEAVWEDDDTRVSIERPLTVKYIDKKVFDALIQDSKAADSRELLRREEFLGDF